MSGRPAAANILLITTDQQRGDCLSLAGHPVLETPHMDYLGQSYEDDADLDRQVDDLLGELSREADLRNCFIEADLCEQGTDRSW